MPRPSSTNYKARRAATPPQRTRPEGAADCPSCAEGWLQYVIEVDAMRCPACGAERPVEAVPEPAPSYPAHWTKGQLLNVRHNGSAYIVTLLEEEFDPHHLERAKFFDSSYDVQAFVSAWYARDSVDPRAG